MALTYSSMLPIGTSLPRFSLLNTLSNEEYNSEILFNGKPTLIMVICNHCPYVIHYHNEIQRIYNDYKLGLNFIAISSNDVSSYPMDNPIEMKKLFISLELDFPYLYDECQTLAKELKAACTPEFYLFDKNQELFYRGRMDNSSPGNIHKVTGSDLRFAIISSLSGKILSTKQHPSMGCSIKWKKT